MATSTIMSTGQITIVDLTDQRPVSFYLQALGTSKIQIYDVNTGKYSPDYPDNNLVISSHFFFGNDDHTLQLKQNNLKYTINGVEASSLVSSGLVSLTGNTLTIATNIGSQSQGAFAQDKLKIVASLIVNDEKADKIIDPITGIEITQTLSADIEIVKVNTGTNGTNGTNGADGAGVIDIRQLYQLSDSSSIAPTKPDSPTSLNNWSPDNPSWDSTKVQYLWICTETAYSDGRHTYTTPYTDENWKTAAGAVASMENSFGTLKNQVDILQNEVDSAIETWYIKGEPSVNNPPWGDEDSSTHVGDLYYDTETGYSYRFFKKNDGTYEWTRLSDSDITKALEDVANLQTVVDEKVTIYYDATEPEPSETLVLNIGDLWMPADGNFYKWDGKDWVLANEIIDRIEVQYAKNQSNTSTEGIEESDWSTTTPEWEQGWYIWQRTVTYYREDTVGTPSEPSCISVAGAAGADAVFAIVESDSKIIFTDNDEADIILNAILYVGGKAQKNTEESPITYSWSAIDDDTPNTIVDSKTSQLTVHRSDVLNIRTFICTITYKENTYTDRITISDKTDPIYCVIESSAGDKFTNGVVNTTLKCRVFKGEGEVDSQGTIYNYSWQKYDKGSSTPDSTFGTGGIKTGKTIQVEPEDVSIKAVFTCTVTKVTTTS